MAGLRWGAWLCLVVALCAVAAGAMEAWRFALLLRGRTEVLLAGQVNLNDTLVVAFSMAAAALALSCVVVVVPAVLATAEYAAARSGRRQSGTATRRVLRFIIPGWNLYGAGENMAHTDALLRSMNDSPEAATGEARLQPGRLAIWWWVAWVINGCVVIAVIVRGLLGQSVQAAADSVELHIALDFSAAVVALLTAAMMRRFVRLISPPVDRSLTGWIVVPDRSRRPPPAARPTVAAEQPVVAAEQSVVAAEQSDVAAEQPEVASVRADGDQHDGDQPDADQPEEEAKDGRRPADKNEAMDSGQK